MSNFLSTAKKALSTNFRETDTEVENPFHNNGNLNKKLMWLARYGRPWLYQSKYDGFWRAKIEMNVVVDGASFEITSPGDHEMPEDAIDVLYDRMCIALKSLNVDM